MSSSWDLLDEKAETELHKARLLNVEEKPFKRVAKRLGTITTMINELVQPQSGPGGQDGQVASKSSENEHLKEDILLDFAAFDSNVVRLQFLHDANAAERERYAADQQRILLESQTVRSNNAQLREQLDEARATLAQRKKFDELAEKITSNRLLRPRDDQIANLAKLEEECRELERESETYSVTWNERRDQFNRIMEEGMLLRRQIRDEKEEVDRREGMNEDGDDEGEVDRTGGQTPKNDPSGEATPQVEGEESSKPDGENGTPRPTASTEVGTPAPGGDTPEPSSLRPPAVASGTASQSESRLPSRDATPAPPVPAEEQKGRAGADDGDDVEMEERGTQDSGKAGEEETGPMSNGASADSQEKSGDKMEVDG